MTKKLSGSCLCGAVQYETDQSPQVVGDCYCVDCRKSSGTAHCTHIMLPEEGYNVSGELKFYDRAADSGSMVSRGFCPNCSSAIHSTNSGMPGMVFVRASSLDDLDAIAPDMAVYTSRAPSWAKIDANLPSFEEMPASIPGMGE